MISRYLHSKGWPGRHVVELDFRSLAFFRVLFALLLLTDYGIRWIDATAHYSDFGLCPRQTFLQMGWSPYLFSLYMINGMPAFVHLLFVLQVLVAVALLLGYRTRVATLMSWVFLVSLHNRNPWLLNGGDVYARCILFWMLFLPWGQCWSMDAKRGRTDIRWWTAQAGPEGKGVRGIAPLAVLLQVSMLYWFAALPKTHPSWVGDYSAINIALHLDHLVKPFGITFRETFKSYLPTLTYLVFHWEFWGPFLLWFPLDKGQVRIFAILVFEAMHLGFEACFQIGLFPFYCMAVLFVLLPGWFWERPFAWLNRELDKQLGASGALPLADRSRRRFVREGVCAFFMVYVMCWNFGNEQFRPSLWLPDSWDWIGYTLRLDQRWNMFSPSPPYQDGWWVVVGKRGTGEEVNMLDPGAPISFDKPKDIAGSYLTQRRRRWMMELRSTESKILMASTCRYLCSLMNPPQRSLNEVRTVTMYYMLEITGVDGSEWPPQKLTMYEYDNFPPNHGVVITKPAQEFLRR